MCPPRSLVSRPVPGPPRIAGRRSLGVTVAAVLFAALVPAAQAGTVPVAPGADLSGVYNFAQPGDVIELACGSYGNWDTPDGATKQITVRAASRNCAKFSRLHAHSSNLTLDGIDIDAGGGVPDCDGGECAAFDSWEVTNVTFKNGRIGNV